MKKEDWLIAVTAGRWQRHGILQARALGLKVLAVDADPQAEGFVDADQCLAVDLDDTEAIAAAAGRLDGRIAGAVSFASDAGVMPAARLRERLGLPGARPELCRLLLDKSFQRAAWKGKDVPGPRWQVLRDARAAHDAIAKFGFPLIIKPADSSGSRGVTKLESAADDIGDAVARAFQFSKTGAVLLESFMDGIEFTVEVFAAGGVFHVLAVTEKKKVEGTRGTVARELATPDRPAAVVDKIAQTVVAAFCALGYTDGPGHAEAILCADGFVGLVEVAGRGGGFMVFDKLVPAASGVNIARLTAQQAAGYPLDAIAVDRAAVVLRFTPSRPGFLRGISGMDVANAVPGVEAAAFVEPGKEFQRAIADGDRMGYIFAKAATPAQAQRAADEAEAAIKFDIGGKP